MCRAKAPALLRQRECVTTVILQGLACCPRDAVTEDVGLRVSHFSSPSLLLVSLRAEIDLKSHAARHSHPGVVLVGAALWLLSTISAPIFPCSASRAAPSSIGSTRANQLSILRHFKIIRPSNASFSLRGQAAAAQLVLLERRHASSRPGGDSTAGPAV